MSLKGIYPFGTIGYLRASKRENKLEPRSRTCVLVGWDMNRARDTYKVMDVVTRQLVFRRDVTLHPEGAHPALEKHEDKEKMSIREGILELEFPSEPTAGTDAESSNGDEESKEGSEEESEE